jgi:2-polyprenyl-3-methyl-5-hydroxy-6-metoxy-1,4-benzoquinol methylase
MKKDFSANSGERISAITDDRIITDHLARYKYAAEFIRTQYDKNLKLLGADIFCGSGYGTNILAKYTNSVIFGIDASEESISSANLNFQRSNIFYSSKIFPFNLPNNIFDFICSFESLEHILDYKLFATQLSNSLKNSGFLLISCPNSDRIDLDINPYHWHYKHLNPLELENLFVENGFTLLKKLSTLCVIPDNSRKVIAVNHFAIPKNEILNDLSGDTLLFIFRKN